MITRRFWPFLGGAEMMMANLSQQFHQLGHRVKLLTARWDPHWPTEWVHGDVPVVRLPQPTQRGWGTLRYMMEVTRWLRRHRREWDVVLVSMLKHDAYAALTALRRTPLPVVLRAEGGGETGDCHWQRWGRFGNRIARRCREADAVIAVSPQIVEELRQSGYPRERIVFIPNGVPMSPPQGRRREARLALADANFDLSLPHPDAPVVLYTGRLHEGKGLQDLIQAWPKVINVFPDARLWLVGDGPYRATLFQLIKDLDLVGRVLMPGTFDQIDDLLEAANLFVLPSYAEGLSLSLMEAMGAGVPVIATRIPGNELLLQHGQFGQLVPPHHAEQLAQTLISSLRNEPFLRRTAELAREHVVANYRIDAVAQAHLELFQACVERRCLS